MIKIFLLLHFALLWSSAAYSEIITWEIKSSITDIGNQIDGFANLGDVVTMRYTFESNISDSDARTDFGKYQNAIQSIEISFSSQYAFVNSTESNYISTQNGIIEDSYLFEAFISDNDKTQLSYNNFNYYSIFLDFQDVDALMFNGTSLPTNPDFLGYDNFRFYINLGKPSGLYVTEVSSVFANDLISIERISSVPIPASTWLLGSGLITLVSFSRRKTKT